MTRQSDVAPVLPAAFHLVVACCAWPRSEQRSAAIRDSAQAIGDWSSVLRVAKRHRVLGLLQDGITEAAVALPADVAADLRRGATAIARKNLLLLRATLTLQRAFEAAKIRILFLKGASLASLAYGTQALKHAWDIDAIVSPEDIDAASAILAQCGYRRVLPPDDFARFRLWMTVAHECIFHHPALNVYCELHWRLVGNPLMLPDLCALSQNVALDGAMTIRTLADEALFSYLCVHGAYHGWSRLKWTADVAAFLAHRTVVQIDQLYRSSRSAGVGRCSAQALLLCSRLFGTVLSQPLLAELRSDSKTLRLEKIALDVMTSGNAEKEVEDLRLGNLKIVLSRALFRDDWRYRWEELCFLSVGFTDFQTVPLPKWLYFLYPLIRIPSWLCRVPMRAGRRLAHTLINSARHRAPYRKGSGLPPP